MRQTFLSGPRVRLRPLERADLPRYRELTADLEINLYYGGLGVPENLGKLQRRYDAGEFDATDRHHLSAIWVGEKLIGEVELRNSEKLPSRAATFGIFIEAGFRGGGTRRENHWSRGRFWDDVLMGITAEEWFSKHGPPPPPSDDRRDA